MKIGSPTTTEEMEEYFDLRWRILRESWNQPRGSEKDEFEDQAIHITIRDTSNRLLGVVRLHLNTPQQGQLRYMAVEQDVQGKGIGRMLVEALEKKAFNLGVEEIVLNARTEAVRFYEKLGYVSIGKGPTVFGGLTHSHMRKYL